MTEQDVKCGNFGTMTLGDPNLNQTNIYACGKYEGWAEERASRSGSASLRLGKSKLLVLIIAFLLFCFY